MSDANRTLSNSIEIVVSCLISDEIKNFTDNFEYNESKPTYDEFVNAIEDHLVYHLIVLSAKGDKNTIQTTLTELYNELF